MGRELSRDWSAVGGSCELSRRFIIVAGVSSFFVCSFPLPSIIIVMSHYRARVRFSFGNLIHVSSSRARDESVVIDHK